MAEGKERKEKEARTARLFDQVLVVGVLAEAKPKPAIRYQFPSGPEAAALSMAQFCLPDLDVLQPTNEREPEKFSFVLTESDGSRRFGLVLRHLPPPPPSDRYPVCFCVVSFLPCYAMFDQLLGVVEAKWALSAASVTAFLEAVRVAPVPAPGASCVVRAPYTRGGNTYIEQYRLARPAEGEYMLEHLDYGELLRASAPAHLVSIFASLLCERRCVFVSSQLTVLSNFVQALVALLHPVAWQYIYIPVLPKALLSFVCAPMPFVVGVLAAHLPEVRRMGQAMDEVLLFDIDADRFLARPFDDRKLVPPSLAQPLLSDLERFAKSARKKKERKDAGLLRREMGDAFVSFFLDLLGSYSTHLRVGQDKATASFDRDEMLRAAPDNVRELLEQVLQTQMFDCFIREREEAAVRKKASIALGAFDQRVYMLSQMERALARAAPSEVEALKEAMASVRRPKPVKKSKMAVLTALVGGVGVGVGVGVGAGIETSNSSSSTSNSLTSPTTTTTPVISRPLPHHDDTNSTPRARSPSPQLPLTSLGASMPNTARAPSPRGDKDEPLSPRAQAQRPALGSSLNTATSNSSATTASAANKARGRGQRQAMVLNDRALENADDDVFALLARRPTAPPVSLTALRLPVPVSPASVSVSVSAPEEETWMAALAPPKSPRVTPTSGAPSTPIVGISRSSRGGTPASPPLLPLPTSASTASAATLSPTPPTRTSGGNNAPPIGALAQLLASLTREEVECWSVEDTAKWASDIGHATASSTLRAHAIDGLVLLDLDSRDLDELALPSVTAIALLRYIDHWRRRRNG